MTLVFWLRSVNLLIHICAGLFWLGWMVFIFFLLTPVLRETIPGSVETILPPLKQRIRGVVFWLIGVILVTGAINVYFTGLYRLDVLLATGYGHRFLIKLGAALTLFSVYFLAPHLTGSSDSQPDTEKQNFRMGPDTMMVVLHVIAFSAGLTAALLGLTL